MIEINGKEIERGYIEDPIVRDYLEQITFIDMKIKEIKMEQSRLDVARIVYSNSLIKYIESHPLDGQ
jgi:hypothetical protein